MTNTTDNPIDVTGKPAIHDGALRGRRLSWAEFYALRPDLRPVNDNRQAAAIRRAGELLKQIEPAKNQHDASARAGTLPSSRVEAEKR